jgi:uncharacterized protein YukE
LRVNPDALVMAARAAQEAAAGTRPATVRMSESAAQVGAGCPGFALAAVLSVCESEWQCAASSLAEALNTAAAKLTATAAAHRATDAAAAAAFRGGH